MEPVVSHALAGIVLLIVFLIGLNAAGVFDALFQRLKDKLKA